MTDRRRSESGNVFFTLFGAVALVGVIGAATATLMRGPVGTMVTLNQKAKVDAQMEIAGKLSLLEAASQKLAGVDDSDCDADGYIEPLPPVTTGCTTSPTGGGCLPAEVGSAKQDPWGTNYGYCAWDIGPIATGACRTGLHAGEDGQDKMVMAIISAGADRTFQTSCSDGPTYLTRVSGSDDIILDYTYAAALTASGGLWVLKSGAPGTATIDKSIEVSGTAKFQNGITGNTSFSGGAFNFAGATGFYLPNQTNSGVCAPSNVGSLRTNNTGGQILQICDSTKVGNVVADPPDGDGWVDVGGSGAANAVAGNDGEVQYNNGGAFGAEAAFKWDDTADQLITSKLRANGAVDFHSSMDVSGGVDMGSTLDVTGASTFGSTVDVTGNLSTDADLDVAGNAGINTNLNVGGNTDLTGTLDVTGVSTFGDDALIKSGSSGDPGLAFSAASTTGLFYASGGIGMSVGGTERAEVTSSGFSVLGNETVSGTAAITGNVAGAGFHLGTLASGNGLYSNGAGGLTLNTGALPRIEIDSAGDIGIALAGAPTTDLDIGGVIRLRQMGAVPGSACGAIEGAITYSSGDVLLVCSNVTGNWETIGTSGGGGGGAASYWTKLVDGRIYYNANNVGIGTNDPLAKLHVNGDILVTGGYTGTASMNAAGAGTRFVFDPESGSIRAGTVSGTQWNDGSVGNHSIAFGNNVTASGTYSMGLGLGINGGTVSGASSYGIFMGDQTGVTLSDPNVMALLGGRMVIDPNEPATVLTPAGSLSFNVIGDVGAVNYCDEDGLNCFSPADIAGGITIAPGNNREVIYNSGGILGASNGFVFTSAGFLGLGTSAPAAALEVAGTDAILFPRGQTSNRPVPAVNGMMRYNSVNDRFEAYQGGAWQDILTGASIAAAPDRGIQFNSGNALAASTNLVYTSAGFMGIGTSNPQARLHVRGEIRAGESGTDGQFRLVNSGNVNWTIDPIGSRLRFRHNASSDQSVIFDGATNPIAMGINVNTPLATLDVTSTDSILFPRGTDAERPASPVNGMMRYSSTGNDFEVYANGAWRKLVTSTGGAVAAAGLDTQIQYNSGGILYASAGLVFTPAGYIGIGTASPAYPVDANGTIRGTGLRAESTAASDNAYLYLIGKNSGFTNSATIFANYDGGLTYLPSNSSLSSGFLHRFQDDLNATVMQIGTAANRSYVGIGTTTPSATLEVAGTDSILFPRGNTTNRPSSPVNGMMRYNSTNDRFEAYQAGTWQDILTNASLAAAPDRGIQFNSGNSLAATSTFVYDSSGRFGVGTSTPLTPFHFSNISSVSSGLYSAGDFFLQTNQATNLSNAMLTIGAGRSILKFNKARGTATSPTTVIANETVGTMMAGAFDGSSLLGNASIDFYTEGTVSTGSVPLSITFQTGSTGTRTEKMRITSAGNVGIGTTGPLAVLDLRASTDAILFPQGLDATRPATPQNGMMRYSSTGNDFEVYANNAWRKLVTSSGGLTAAAGSDTYIQYNSNGSLAGSSGLVFTSAGNVGIGTTAPGNRLTVTNTTPDTPIVADNNSTVAIYGNGSAFFKARDATADIEALLGVSTSSGEGFVGTMTGHSFSLRTSNVKRLTISGSTGNVGIGTVSPLATLEVAGTDSILFPRGNTTNRPASPVNGMMRYNSTNDRFEAYQAGTWQDILTNASLAAAPDRGIQFNSGNSLAAVSTFTYQSNGYIGLGIASPLTPVHAYANTTLGSWGSMTIGNAVMTISEGAAGTTKMALDGNTIVTNNDLYIGTIAASAAIRFGVNNTERMVLDSSGNLGLGIVNPGAKLEVTGTDSILFPRGNDATRPAVPQNGMMRYSSTGNDFEVYANNAWRKLVTSTGGLTAAAGSDTYVQYNSGGYLAGSANMVFTSAGYLGIGTTSPSSPLTVSGSSSSGISLTVNNTDTTGLSGLVTSENGTTTGIAQWRASANSVLPSYFRVGSNIASGGTIVTYGFGSSGIVLTSAGRFGFGTATPSVPFEVQLAANQYANIYSTSASNNVRPLRIGTTGSAGSIAFARYSDGSPQGMIGYVSSTDSSQIDISANGGGGFMTMTTVTAERMRITATGKVGIGTTSPATLLDTQGTLRMAYGGESCSASTLGGMYYSSATGNFYVCGTAGSWTQVSTGSSSVAAGSNTQVQFNSGGNLGASSIFVWDNTNGYLGLGTANPQGRLNVNNALTNFAPSLTVPGIAIDVNGAGDAGGTSSVRALQSFATATGSNAISVLTAARTGGVANMTSGTLSSLNGTIGSVSNTNAGTVTNGNVFTATGTLSSSGGITSYRAFYSQAPTFSSTGAMATGYGLYLDDLKTAGATTAYGIYQAGLNDKNYFAGRIGQGTTSPATALDVNGTIRMAYGGESCSASTEGAIYYDSAADRFYACQTSGSWTQIATGASTQAAGSDQQVQINNNGVLYASSGLAFNSTSGKLSLYGDLELSKTTPYIRVPPISSFSYLRIIPNDSNVNSNGGISFYNGLGSLQASINGNNAGELTTTSVWSRNGTGDFTIKTNTGTIFMLARNATDVALTVKGATSQTADLQQWFNTGGSVLSRMTSTGQLALGGATSPQAQLDVQGTDAILFPRGGAGNRPSSPVNGMMRYNSVNDRFEAYQAGTWQDILTNASLAAAPDRGIQFNSGNSLAAVSTFTYTSVGYMGLGSAAPTAHFYETSAGIPNMRLVETTSGASAQIIFENTARTWEIGGDSVPDGFYIGPSGTQTTFFITPAGNVGLGTTAPLATLDLRASTDAILFPQGLDATRPASPQNGMMRYSSTGNDFEVYANNAWRKLVTSTGGLTAAAGSDTQIQYNSNGSLAGASGFVYTSAGQMGIGTSSPSASLMITNTGSSSSLLIEDSASPDSTPFQVTQDGYVGINVGNPWAPLVVGGGVSVENNTDFLILDPSGAIGGASNVMRLTWGDDNTDRFALYFDSVINSEDMEQMTVLANGNVGIGATSPAARLEVGGTDAILFPRGGSGNRPLSPVNGMMRYNSVNDRFEAYQAGTWQDILTNASLAAAPDRGIQFNSGNSLAAVSTFTYTSVGYLGVGTATPSTDFTLKQIGTNGSTSGFGLEAPTSSLARIYIDGNDILRIRRSSTASDHFYLSPNGNVGIGGTPTASLDVATTGAIYFPRGTDAERPSSPFNGMMRYSSTGNDFEVYANNAWRKLVMGSSSSTSNAAGSDQQVQLNDNGVLYASTGLSFSSSSGVLTVTNGAVRGGAGSVTAPGISFAGDTNTGLYNISSDKIGLTTNGTLRLTIQDPSTTDAVAVFAGTSAITLPTGLDATRPSSAVNGMMRYSTTSNDFEVYANGNWKKLVMGFSSTISAAGADTQIQYNSNGVQTGASGFVYTALGKVGINNISPATHLDVNGTLRMAYGGESCSASTLGGMYYSSATGNFYVCGTAGSWTQVATGSSSPAAGSTGYVQFNSGGNLGADSGLFWDNTNKYLGLGTTSPSSVINTVKAFTAGSTGWGEGVAFTATGSGASGSYLGVVGTRSYATISATGNTHESFGIYGSGYAANDATAQGATGVLADFRIHSGDTGYGITVQDDNASTGGTGYGVYINLDDTDITRYGIYQVTANTNYFAGNIGIGTTSPALKLDVADAIRVGSSQYGCAVATKGAIRYNSSTNVFDFCNGTTWAAMGKGGALAIDDLSDAITDYTTSFNMFLGSNSGIAIQSGGQYNTALGIDAGKAITTGDENTIFGWGAGSKINTGGYNTLIGLQAGLNLTSGDLNTYIGHNAGNANQTGTRNTAVGQNAGINNTGSDNVFLGQGAGSTNTTGSGNIVIGRLVTTPAVGSSNTLNIGDTIYGDLSTDFIGIGTNNPGAKLEVTGTDAILFPRGNDATRPSTPQNGMMRYSSTGNNFEVYANGSWQKLVMGSSSSTVAGSDRQIQFNSGNTLSASSTFVYSSVNYLGLGTASPALNLQVESATTTTMGVYGNAGGNSLAVVFMQSDGSTAINSIVSQKSPSDATARTLTFKTGATELIRLAPTSRIGISTTSPVSILDARGSTDAITFPQGLDATRPSSPVNGMMRYSSTGNDFEVYANGSWQKLVMSASSSATTVAGSDQQVQLNNNGVLYASTGLTFNSSTGNLIVTNGAVRAGAGNSGVPTFSFAGDTDTGIYNSGTDALSLATGSSQRLYLDNSGVSAYVPFQMYSGGTVATISAQGLGDASNYSQFNLRKTADNKAWSMSFNKATLDNGFMLQYFDGSATYTTAMMINPGTFKIGFGTVAPVTKIDVNGSIRMGYGGESCSASTLGAMYYSSATGLFYACGTAGSWAQISTGTSSVAAGSNTYVQFNSGGVLGADSNYVWDNTNKRLGIGTTPALALDVADAIKVGSSQYGCVTATKGAIRYNSSTNVFDFCNGTAWAAMGKGGVIAIDDLSDAITDYTTDYNVFMGSGSGITIQSGGQYNTAVGIDAGRAITTGDNNLAMGYRSLYTNSTGSDNMAIGRGALYTNNGNNNTAVGSYALLTNSSGADNTAIGRSALYTNSTGANNTAIGKNALQLSTGNGNIAIGYNAGDALTAGASNIIIGYDIDAPSSTGSNQLTIGNLIFGTGIDGTGTSLSSGNIGIGTATPAVKLDVADAIRIGSSQYGCVTATKGAIRYNSSTNVFDFCNGTAWAAVNSGATVTPAGSDTQIQYNSNGVLSASSGFVYSSVGTVGIGRNPSYRLDIFGNSVTSGIHLTGSTNADSGLYINSPGTTEASFAAGANYSSYSNPNYVMTAKTSTASGMYFIGGTARIFTNSGLTAGNTFTTSTRLYIGLTGDVGVGTMSPVAKLDVSGDVRFYSTANTLTCNSLAKGGLRYNSVTDVFDFCNGTSWAAIATPTAETVSIDNLSDAATNYTSHNMFLGSGAGAAITSGTKNVTLGEQAGTNITSGGQNTFMGWQAGLFMVSGSENTFIGNSAGVSATGSGNVFIGKQAGYATTSGDQSVYIGQNTGLNANTGGYNTMIGNNVGTTLTTGTKNVLLGFQVDVPANSTSNYMSLGNLIFGTNIDGTGTTVSTGNIGIGTKTPAAKLDVAEAIRVGSSQLGCVAGTVGALRYNSTTNAFDYCGGVSPAWTAFGSGTSSLGTSTSAASPSRSGDATTGFYSAAGTQVSVANAGIQTMQWNTVASGVNYISVSGGATGAGPTMIAVGTDTNIDLNLNTTGAGLVNHNGGIKIGSATIGCVTGTKGAIRYNSTNNNFDYCGGSTPAWTSFSSSVTPGGSDQQVQINNNGVLYASSGLTFNSTSGLMTLTGKISVSDRVALGATQTGMAAPSYASVPISSLASAAAINTVANANYAQTWNWDTLSTQTALTLGSGSMTSGSILAVTSSYNNVSATGAVTDLTTTGTSSAAVPLRVNNAGTGLSFRVNDDGTTTDTTPFAIDASGNTGIGTATPVMKLDVAEGIKIGSSQYGCVTATKGAIRYNSTNNNFDYCGGSTPSWTAFSSGVTPGGSDQQVQINNNGVLYASTGLTFSSSTGLLNVTGKVGVSDRISFGAQTGLTAPAYPSTALSSIAAATTSNIIANANYAQTWNWDTNTTGTAMTMSSGSTTTGSVLAVTGSYNNASSTGYILKATVTGTSSNAVPFGIINAGNGLSLRINDDGTATDTTPFVIDASGNVGIQKTTPAAALDVVGNIQYTGTITDVSDMRLKTDIRPLNERGSMLGKLGEVKTYSFVMKDDPKKQIEFGVMAQELEKTFPELVHTAKDAQGTKSVNYVGLIAPMIKAGQELEAENKQMKAELAALKAQQNEMKTAMNDIQEDMKGMKAHTGYGINKAGMDGWMMMLIGAVIGGNVILLAVGIVRRRKS